VIVEGGSPCTFTDKRVGVRRLRRVRVRRGAGTNALNKGCGASGWTWARMTLVGAQQGGNPPTTWIGNVVPGATRSADPGDRSKRQPQESSLPDRAART
jgi:hypothetical protein